MSTQETPIRQPSLGVQWGWGGLRVLEAERLGPTRRRPPPHRRVVGAAVPSLLGVLLLGAAFLAALLAPLHQQAQPRRGGRRVTGEEGEHPSTPTDPGA